MLDPENEPSRAREIAHKSKGCFAVLLSLAVLIAGGYFVWDRVGGFLDDFGLVPDYEGKGAAAVTVVIPEGSSLDGIGDILLEKDVVKSVQAWDEAVKNEAEANKVQAGSYAMKTQLPAAEALKILLDPNAQVHNQFTVKEGLRLTLQVAALAKETKISAKSYDAALKKPGDLGLPSWANDKPEGFLFPETYELPGDASATSVMKQMAGQFNKVVDGLRFEDKAKSLDISAYEAVVIASIIEREVSKPEDRAKVARVIYNRLEEKEPLGMDSTVHYAVNKDDKVTTTDKDRQSDSKYNTYNHKGLPPGPISAPGEAALEAAVNPADGDWFYFVTVNLDTGETKFAKSAKKHQKNVDEFQAWCQANKGRC